MKIKELSENGLILFDTNFKPESFGTRYISNKILNQLALTKYGDKELLEELNEQSIINSAITNILEHNSYYLTSLYDMRLVTFNKDYKKNETVTAQSNSENTTTDSRSTYDTTTLEDIARVKGIGNSNGTNTKNYQDFLPSQLIEEHRKVIDMDLYDSIVKCVVDEITIGIWGCG